MIYFDPPRHTGYRFECKCVGGLRYDVCPERGGKRVSKIVQVKLEVPLDWEPFVGRLEAPR